MTGMLRRLAVAGVLALALPWLGAPGAHAADAFCEEHPEAAQCQIDIGDGGGDDGGGDGGDDGSGGGTTACTWNGPPSKVVPCDGDTVMGISTRWSNGRQCYLGGPVPMDDPYWQEWFPPGHAVWGGHYPEGGIYVCAAYDPTGTAASIAFFWSQQAPDVPDPEALARRAVASLGISAITIGSAPDAAGVGVVGMPVWLWAEGAGPTTVGPLTSSVSAGGYTVSLTARLERVVWSMGDGTEVTCTGAGTAYADAYGRSASPDCGHRYVAAGVYDVSATSYWVVEWAGIGRTGEIPVDVSRGTTLTVAEVQVLTN